MLNKVLSIVFLAVILLSACNPAPVSTPTVVPTITITATPEPTSTSTKLPTAVPTNTPASAPKLTLGIDTLTRIFGQVFPAEYVSYSTEGLEMKVKG